MQSTCERCNTTFEHSSGNHRRFCSAECRKAGPIEPVGDIFCVQCSNEIIKDKRKGKKFCSRECFAVHLSETRSGIPRPEVSGPRPDLQNRVTLICQRCDKEYQVKKSHEHRSKYCSKKCTRNQVEITCIQCQKPYAVKAAEVERSRFCSKDCYHEWMRQRTGPDNPKWSRTEVACDQCGELTHKTPYDINTKEHIFCSDSCYRLWYSLNKSGKNSHNWLGGSVNWRGASWQRQRRKALRRDGGKCQHCGRKPHKGQASNQVHHIIPFREFGVKRHEEANSIDNLITLCPSCHGKAESGVIPIQPYLI